jgi:hypothetical protein
MSLWNVLVSIFWFMILFTWVWLLITIFSDIFRDHELSGWGKALWTLFLVIVPWLGAIAYLIVRGRSMNERTLAQKQHNEQAFGQYVREAAGTGAPSTADELGKLTDLRERGAISSEEFEHAKAKALGRDTRPTTPAQADERVVPTMT